MKKFSHRKVHSESGITLVEVIIYVAVFTITIVGLLSILSQIIKLKSSANSYSVISSEASLVLEQIIQDMRKCDSFRVNDLSTLQINIGSSEKEYTLNESSVILIENLEEYRLTTDQVKVKSLEFYDWTSINSDNIIHIKITLEKGGISENFQTSVHKR